MELEYKVANEYDINRIYTLSKQLIDQYEDIQSIAYEKVLAWVYKKIEENIHEYRSVFFDGEHVGYYRLHEEDGKLELDDLYIFDQYQNKGIGSTILNKILFESDLPIFLYVFIKNERAVNLYKKFGFIVIENIKNSRYIMQKD